MSGLGTVLGGALSGFGAGIAKQGELDWQQRRDMALESLRNQNQQDNMRLQASEQRTTQREQADLNDRNDARKTARDTSSTITIDKNRSQLDTASRERLARLESALRSQQTAESARIEAQIRSGEIIDTLQDADGNYYALYRNGQQKPLNIKGAPKAPPGGSGSNILDRAGAAPGSQPATPGAKVSISNW